MTAPSDRFDIRARCGLWQALRRMVLLLAGPLFLVPAVHAAQTAKAAITQAAPAAAKWQPDAQLTKKVVSEAARRGLILLSCGTSANVIRILVPLTAADALLDEGMAILAESLAASV